MNDINKVVNEMLNAQKFFGNSFSFPKSFYRLGVADQTEVIRRYKQALKPPDRKERIKSE
jgi:hypothetical protein